MSVILFINVCNQKYLLISGETMSVKEQVSLPSQRICSRCKFVSSQEVCKACVLLEGLNKGLPKLGIGKSSKAKRMLEEYHSKQTHNGTGELEDAIKDLNDTNSIAVNESNTLIKSKKNLDKKNKSNDKCNKNNCCGGSCTSNAYNVDPATGNKKLNMLLEQYGLDETTSPEKQQTNHEKVVNNGTNVSDNSDDENSLLNGQEDDDTCSGTCGRMGSIQIGF